MATTSHTRTGLWLGIGAYTAWGLLPFYFHLLDAVPPLQVLAHRILWSLLLLAAILVATRRWRGMVTALRGRTLLALAASAALIAANWFVYIWAIDNAHLVEASLGYFINPLVNVALGVLVLGERLGRVQAAAVAIAACGVLILAILGGGALWISLALALSFAVYGLIRKMVAIDALGGLTAETALLAPLALGVLLVAGRHGEGAFGGDPTLSGLLVLAGPITAAPLLMFAAGARRLRYATMGLLQYIAPTLQFLEAVLLYGEPVRPAQLVTFAMVWTGCALYAWRSIAAARRDQLPG
jgi:chloramphenicol-sensitive protein RarD